jgi:hypothetical protein
LPFLKAAILLAVLRSLEDAEVLALFKSTKLVINKITQGNFNAYPYQIDNCYILIQTK